MLKVLGKGEWRLDGMEILAFGEMMRWFSNIQKNIEQEIVAEEAVEKFKAEEAQKLKEGKLEPKPVEDVIKPINAPPVVSKTKGKK
jgi:hypothetical protein